MQGYPGSRLWLGPLAALLLFAGILAIGLVIPGYSHVRQTVSELGEAGSPGQLAFTVLLCLVAACLGGLATGIARTLRASAHSTLPAWFVGAMAISVAGVGLFAFPHPLHNFFGMSELVGYQAPLAAALVCRRAPALRPIAAFSIVMYALVVLALAGSLTTLDRHGAIWAFVEPVYGLVQRALFAAWFFWCAGFAVLLMRSGRESRGQ